MERHELEDRIRASLQARAGDVEPTPTLWQRVSDRVGRRAWWQVGAWTLSGAAVVAVAVVGVAALLDTPPRTVEIDPVQSETAPPTEPEPTATPTATPTPTASATPTTTQGGGGGGAPRVVTADGDGVHEIDPATGQVLADLPVFAPLAEGGPVGDVAVRPGSDAEQLVVATMIGIEGRDWELQLTTFGPDRQVQASTRINVHDDQGTPLSAGGDFTGEAFPPTVTWSADGQYLAWGRQTQDGVTVYAAGWEELQVEPDQVVPSEVAQVPSTNGVPARVQDWTGDPQDGSLLLLSTAEGVERLSVCLPTGVCEDGIRGQLLFEGGSIIDVDHLTNGSTVVLVARSGSGQDAENATLELIANPMDDTQRTLSVPDGTFPTGTAATYDGWLAAGGNRVAVGFDTFSAQLLTVSGELAEELQVTDDVALPEGTTAVDVGAPLVTFGAE